MKIIAGLLILTVIAKAYGSFCGYFPVSLLEQQIVFKTPFKFLFQPSSIPVKVNIPVPPMPIRKFIFTTVHT